MKINFLKNAAILGIIGLSAFIASPTLASSICDQCKDGGTVPAEVCAANGCDWHGNEEINTFEGSLTGILNNIIGAMGIIAVIFIIIGGINYLTSAGDTAKREKGKKTILYACIGLVICALAFAIVNWVISGALGGGTTGGNQG